MEDRVAARQAAERSVADARRERDEAADARAPRVPRAFRVKGLSALPPRRQAALFEAARREARGSPPVHLAALGVLLGVISALWGWRTGGDPAALALWAAALPLVTLVWAAAVRRAMARSVREALEARTAEAAGDPPTAR